MINFRHSYIINHGDLSSLTVQHEQAKKTKNKREDPTPELWQLDITYITSDPVQVFYLFKPSSHNYHELDCHSASFASINLFQSCWTRVLCVGWLYSGFTCGEDKHTKTGQTRLLSDSKHIWFNWKGHEKKWGHWWKTPYWSITAADTKNKSDSYWWRAAASVYRHSKMHWTICGQSCFLGAGGW